MGYIINKTTYEVQTCPTEAIMVDNGWSSLEWEFVEELEHSSKHTEVQIKQAELTTIAKKAAIQTELDSLELKRSRALAEPEIKDEETGETWLEYRTKQIQALRVELNTL